MRSMTAYAHVTRKKDSQSLQLIIRSLNFKYLDVSIHNLNIHNIILEEKIKKEIRKRIHRGKVEVFIFSKEPAANQVFIDEKITSQYISQIKRLARKHNLKPNIDISDILHLPHATYWEEKKEKDQSLILPALREAMSKLIAFKEKQGSEIKRQITKNLKELRRHIHQIKKNKPKVYQTENGKGDIDEEVSLMSFYTKELEKKINAKNLATKGKALDFLTQEILRELNAASSKTKAKRVAALIVEAKNYLDRIREQAQNVE